MEKFSKFSDHLLFLTLCYFLFQFLTSFSLSYLVFFAVFLLSRLTIGKVEFLPFAKSGAILSFADLMGKNKSSIFSLPLDVEFWALFTIWVVSAVIVLLTISIFLSQKK